MQAGHDPVELLQHVVLVVERAVGQDVHLRAGQQRDAVELRIDLTDPLYLAQQLVGLHVVAKAVRGRVVRDRHVLVALLDRRLRHLLERVAAVGGGGVAVQVALQVRALD